MTSNLFLMEDLPSSWLARHGRTSGPVAFGSSIQGFSSEGPLKSTFACQHTYVYLPPASISITTICQLGTGGLLYQPVGMYRSPNSMLPSSVHRHHGLASSVDVAWHVRFESPDAGLTSMDRRLVLATVNVGAPPPPPPRLQLRTRDDTGDAEDGEDASSSSFSATCVCRGTLGVPW